MSTVLADNLSKYSTISQESINFDADQSEAPLAPISSQQSTWDISSISQIGVSIELIREFVKIYGITADQNLSTSTVCAKFVQPATENIRDCLINLFREEAKDNWETHLEAHLYSEFYSRVKADSSICYGKATVFVSHAWADPFMDLVDVLERYQARHTDVRHYFWIDLFVNSQHDTSVKPFEWWSTLFRETVLQIGFALVVFNPWSKPTYTTRAWCLFEFYILTEANLPIEIVLSQRQEQDMFDFFSERVNLTFHTAFGKANVFNAVTDIDIEQANAFKKSDLDAIRLVVQQSIGFKVLNRRIINLLQRWIQGVVCEIFLRMSDEDALQSYIPSCLVVPTFVCPGEAIVTKAFLKLADVCRRLCGENSFELRHLNFQLSMFYYLDGNFVESERYWANIENQANADNLVEPLVGFLKYQFIGAVPSLKPALCQRNTDFMARFHRCCNLVRQCHFQAGKHMREYRDVWIQARQFFGSTNLQVLAMSFLFPQLYLLSCELVQCQDMVRTMHRYALLLQLALVKTDTMRVTLECLLTFYDLSSYLSSCNAEQASSKATKSKLRKAKMKLEYGVQHLDVVCPTSDYAHTVTYCLCSVLFSLGEFSAALALGARLVGSGDHGKMDFTMQWHKAWYFVIVAVVCIQARCLARLERFEEAEALLLDYINNREYLLTCRGFQDGPAANPLILMLRTYQAEVLLMNPSSFITGRLNEAEQISNQCADGLVVHFGETYWCCMDSLLISANIADRVQKPEVAVVYRQEHQRRLAVLQRSQRTCCFSFL